MFKGSSETFQGSLLPGVWPVPGRGRTAAYLSRTLYREHGLDHHVRISHVHSKQTKKTKRADGRDLKQAKR
eukprot:s6211_g4.t1